MKNYCNEFKCHILFDQQFKTQTHSVYSDIKERKSSHWRNWQQRTREDFAWKIIAMINYQNSCRFIFWFFGFYCLDCWFKFAKKSVYTSFVLAFTCVLIWSTFYLSKRGQWLMIIIIYNNKILILFTSSINFLQWQTTQPTLVSLECEFLVPTDDVITSNLTGAISVWAGTKN